MSRERLFMDTFFVQALLNRRDRYHAEALALLPMVRSAAEVWVTELVLVEIGNGLSSLNRAGAAAFIRSCYHTPNVRVVVLEPTLMERTLLLYAARPDKPWGLTDCLSFVVMYDHGIQDALTGDIHFRQAGYRTLMAAT